MNNHSFVIGIILIVFLAFSGVASLSIPFAKRFALRFGWVDDASRSNRKIHSGSVPLLGGAAIYLGFLLSLAIYFIFFHQFHDLIEYPNWFGSFAAGGLFVLILGTLDDIYDISPRKKLFAQLLIASLVYVGGIQIDHIISPVLGMVELGAFAFPITVLSIAAVMNAVNIIDGMDGLASGVVLVALAVNFAASLFFGNYFVALLAMVLFFSLLGFMKHNWYPASIFLGDGGSLLLGYCVAVISIQNAQSAVSFQGMLMPLFALVYPVLDISFAIARRVLRGKPMMSADKGHFHHFLLRKGLSPKEIVITAMIFTGAFSCAGLLFVFGYFWIGIFSLLLLFVVSSVSLIASGYFDPVLLQGYLQHRSLLKKFNAYKNYLYVRVSGISSSDDAWSIMVDMSREFCLKGACWVVDGQLKQSYANLSTSDKQYKDMMSACGCEFVYTMSDKFDEHVSSEIEGIIKFIILSIDKRLAKLAKDEVLCRN